MKKILLPLMAALLLPLTLGAMDLEPNQLLMGHYLTDSLARRGWGSTKLDSLSTVATDITPDELAVYVGGDIVAFRVGLYRSTPISRVFVIPVTPDGVLLTDEMTEWPCAASSVGWNLIELATPYKIDLPEGYSLRIGFDYIQDGKTSKPLSVVKVGTVYPTYHLVDGEWMRLVLGIEGNISLQCVVENDNFPQYVIRVRNISLNKCVQNGEDIAYSFETYNLGVANVLAGCCTYEVAVDGQVVHTLINPEALTNQPLTLNGVISTTGLAAGRHTLTITPVAVNGELLENPTVFSTTFLTYDYYFERQMRLVEQFTSTWCTYCPQGTANVLNLTNMRDDIAWVAVHENMGNTDPFRTAQTDSITSYEGIDGFPEASFDRTVGIQTANGVYAVITSLPASEMSSFLDYVEAEAPAWATVNVNSTYNPATRKSIITVNGDLAPGFDGLMGTDCRLTVYITEDGLVYPQTSGGDDYVHNNVLRTALVSVKGVALNKQDDTYKNTFTYTIPDDWNADKLKIVAFISRPLGNPLKDIYVTNANERKFGEYDVLPVVRGDADGDGNVTIDDVTIIIDHLLNDVELAGFEGADCDLSGKITIDDVTVLIDYLLNDDWND